MMLRCVEGFREQGVPREEKMPDTLLNPFHRFLIRSSRLNYLTAPCFKREFEDKPRTTGPQLTVAEM